MDEKEFNALVEKVGEETAKLISAKTDELRAGMITEEKLLETVEQFAKSEQIEDVNKKMDELAINLKKMQKANPEKPKTLAEQIAEKHDDLIKTLSDPARKGYKMNLKTNVTTSSIASDVQGFTIPGFNAPAHKGLVIPTLFSRVQLAGDHHGTVYYTDQTTTTRNAATRNEAATAPESAIGWTTRSISMEKILDSIPLTHEAMMDINQLTAEVERFIDLNIALKMQTQMWSGDNSAPNWAGIYANYATDFTQAIAAAWKAANGGIEDANLADLIAVVAEYISNSKESKYMPDFVCLNPRDLLKLRLEKDANGNYIKVPYMSDAMDRMLNLRVVEASEVTAGTLVVGDGRHGTFYDVEGIGLEFGLDGNDFTQDLITLKGRKRGNLLVKTADTTAFYKVTDITTRISDLTA